MYIVTQLNISIIKKYLTMKHELKLELEVRNRTDEENKERLKLIEREVRECLECGESVPDDTIEESILILNILNKTN